MVPAKHNIAKPTYPYMESPNQYLSPDSCFAMNGCITFEIQGSKLCSTIRPLTLATVLVSFKGPMYGKPQLVPFTRALFCQEWLHQFRDPRVQSVLDYPPPHCGPLFWFLSREPCMESPNQCLSPEPCFAWKGAWVLRSKGPKYARLSAPSHRHNKHSWGWKHE